MRWQGWRGEGIVWCQVEKGGRVARWQGGKGGRVVRW